MPVIVIENGMRLDPDRVYVAGATSHVSITNGTFTLRTPQEGSWPIDAFLTALASEYQNNAIGIVLSGTGNDGTMGLGAIRAEVGVTIVQDASALEPSMPRSAQAADVVDMVLKPEDIVRNLPIVKQLYPLAQRAFIQQENELRRILFLMTNGALISRSTRGYHPFASSAAGTEQMPQAFYYSALLHGMPSEVDTLCSDMLNM